MNDRWLSLFFLKRLVLSSRSSSLIRRISFLSFIGISLSVALFFIVLFVMNGMNHNIEERILALDPHLSITIHKGEIKTSLNEYAQMLQQRLQSQEVVNQTVPYISYDLILRTIDGQFRGTHAVGYSAQGFSYWLQRLKQSRQKTLKATDLEYEEYSSEFELKDNEVAIGIDLARSLGVLEGDTVTLIPAESLLLSSLETPLFEKVTVRKILTTDLPDIDSKALFFNQQTALKSFLQSPTQVRGLHIWLEKINKMNLAKKILTENNVKEVETWRDKNSALFLALFLEKLMIGLFLGLAGLIASSSILTVLALVMSQKKHDIAVIKTLGFSNQRTLKIFMKMGLWISLSAISLGTLIGVGVSLYLQKFPLNILPQVYYDSTIPSLVYWPFVFMVLGVSCALALVGCYIPARAALRIEPGILLKRTN